MRRVAVARSNVSEVGYDVSTATLEVAFHQGGVYRYTGVPRSVYVGLLSAPSVGTYLDVHVSKAGYPVTQLSE